MTTIDVNDFLNQSGAPVAKFPEIGTVVRGTVLSAEVKQQTDMDTGQPLTWDNGDPRMQLVVTLQTDERDPEVTDDDGTRRLFAKGNMLTAIKTAVKKANARLEPGGTLVVKYSGDGEQKKRGFNPPKLYEAAYKAGAPAQKAVDDLLGDEPAGVAPSSLI